MLAIFQSILPIFLLVLLGVGLKRSPLIDVGLWRGLEQLGYYVLFPALLFQTLYDADFSGLAIGKVGLAALATLAAVSLALLAAWPVLRRIGVAGPAFTTVFQTASRWNAFIALAVGQKLAGEEGLAIVALVMAVIVIPINLVNVGLLVWFSHAERNWRGLLRRIVTNPLILGCLAGLAMRASPVPLYGPAYDAIVLIAQSALSLGLIMVGAGLRVQDALRPSPLIAVPIVIKLLLFPAVMLGFCLVFGLGGEALFLMVLCASVPTAMNGYLLARQLGGDAPLYAAVVTLQTVASFFTMPIVLSVARYASG